MGRGKRNAAIVISSSEDDDDDKDFSLKSDLIYSKPASVPRTNPKKRAKKTSLASSCPRPRKGSLTNDFDEIRRFCEEFDDGIRGFKISTGNGMSKELWVDRYKPRLLEELAVHKKKVEEVKVLFEERLTASKVLLYFAFENGNPFAKPKCCYHLITTETSFLLLLCSGITKKLLVIATYIALFSSK